MADTELASFDTDLAETVVQVLRRHGVDAWPSARSSAEVAVHVPAAQREHALQVLAEGMETVNAELAARRASRRHRGAGGPAARRLPIGRRPPADAGTASTEGSWLRGRPRGGAGADDPRRGDEPEGWDDPEGPPLVMERFRRIALNMAVVLAPLLIISLARPPFPLALTVVTLVGGMALIVALRNRQDGSGRS